MSLTLVLPTLTARSADEIELQPQKVKKWLEELPLLNISETGRKLHSTLSIHNRIDFDDKLRLQILELFRYPVSQLSLEFTKQYCGLPLPLSEKHKSIAEQNRQFHMEMANGYKRIVMNVSTTILPGAEEQAFLALAIQRAIRYLCCELGAAYQTYSPCPQNTWKEIHALYARAEELGLGEFVIVDELNKAVPKTCVNHAYKQALLLHFSDPYHLPPRMIDWTHQYLDRWAPLAQLTEATSDYNPTCQFLIDLQNDHAGIAYTTGTVPENSKRYRLLNTIELARQLHAQLTLLVKGEMPPAEGLPDNFFRECGQDLLRRLVNDWGVNPQRAFRRSKEIGHRVEIAIGMDRINYWINGGKKFVVSSTFVGPVPQRTVLASEGFKHKDIQIPGRELSIWDVEDEGAGGLSLSIRGKIQLHIQVGDILITRTSGEGNPWTVGVIRWVRSNGISHIEIGVQHLAPSANPVVIKTVNENGQESDFLPALLLPEIKPLKQTQTLITHRGVFKPELSVFMDNGYRLYRITPTRLIEASQAFEQFSFDIQNA
jgi:cyclic-di-GMP-binding protein